MFDLSTMLSFVFASTLLCLAPGPDNIFVLTQSAVNGRRAGLLITLGICAGLLVHTGAVALGLAVIFQVSEVAFTVLKTVGALYLIYLAWCAFKASDSEIETSTLSKQQALSLFKRGAIMNMTNPKVAIFFLAFLPQFVPSSTPNVAAYLLGLGSIFILVASIVFGSIAILSGSLGKFLKSHPASQKYLNRMAGLVFVAMALKLLHSEQ